VSRTAKTLLALSLLLSVALIVAFVIAVLAPGTFGFAEKSKVDDLQTRVVTVENRLRALDGRVRALQSRVQNLEQFRGALCGQLVATGDPQLRSLAAAACGRRTGG
jgi:hypothetical protein